MKISVFYKNHNKNIWLEYRVGRNREAFHPNHFLCHSVKTASDSSTLNKIPKNPTASTPSTSGESGLASRHPDPPALGFGFYITFFLKLAKPKWVSSHCRLEVVPTWGADGDEGRGECDSVAR